MPRPHTPLLSVDRIVDAAIAMIDAGHPFSIVRLGKRLGVNPSSLYNHVSGRGEIVELIRGRLADDFQIEVPADLGWAEVVEYVVRRQRAMFAAHPLVLPLLVTQTVTDPRVLSYYEELAAALTSAGFPDENILDIVAVLDAFALGSGLDLSAPPVVWRTQDSKGALGRLLNHQNNDDGRSGRAFELGLSFIIEALGNRLNRVPR